MPAYSTFDTIQERRDKEDTSALTRDDWIDKRAKEIEAEYPTEAACFASISLSRDIRMGLQSGTVIEAYHDFVTVAAYDRAEQEWENRFSWLENTEFFKGDL